MMIQKKIQIRGVLVILVLALCAVSLSFVFFHRGVPENEERSLFERISTFSLYDSVGNEHFLYEYKGKPFVVIMWASWCLDCERELLALSQNQKESGAMFEIIAINRAEPPDLALTHSNFFKEEHNILFLLDPEDNVYKATGGYNMPETLFFDGAGNVVHHAHGSLEAQERVHLMSSLGTKQ